MVQREIRDAQTGGRIRVLASDSDTLDGQIPTLALVDELARTKTEEAYGLLRDGLGPRGGRMIAISTAGDDAESPLGKLRTAAHAMPDFSVNGAYHHASLAGFSWHEWALDRPEEADDLELVKAANPASWIDETELLARRDSPSMAPWQWQRFTCGLWVAGEDSAIAPKAWAECAEVGTAIDPGTRNVYIGIDLGFKHDTTAIVPIVGTSDVPHVGTPTIMVPIGDGTALDIDQIFAEVERMTETWPKPTIVIDPEAGGEQLAQRIERELDAVVVTHSQKSGPMSLAAQRLSEAVNARKIRHPADPALTAHVLGAAAQAVGPGWKFVKPRKSGKKIDAVIALAMAHSVLVAEGQAKPAVEPWVSFG